MTDRSCEPGRRGHRGPAVAALLACALAVGGCGLRDRVSGTQPVGWLHSARFGAPPGTGVRQVALPHGGVASGWAWPIHFEPGAPWSPADKLDPRLRTWLAANPSGPAVELLIEYRDPIEIPPFPFDADPYRPSPSADSTSLRHARQMADSLMDLRAPWYSLERARLSGGFGAAMLDSFWLTRSVVARVPLAGIATLAARPDVEWIAFAHRGGRPPMVDCAALGPIETRTSDALVGDGRALLGSDPLRDEGYSAGRLAMLDTGVWSGHPLFAGLVQQAPPNGPGLEAFDCMRPHCDGEIPGDVEVTMGGHGTATAGILVGNASMGSCMAGATRAMVESYRVYKADEDAPGRGMFDPTAFKRACEQALEDGCTVAVLEIAEEQGLAGSICRTAGQLYNGGVTVVAAAGNGADTWLGSPGIDRRVLAVGSRLTRAPGQTEPTQSRGTLGFRRKPDLAAPTATTSAGLGATSNGEPPTRFLDGTSGATPYAGAAALMLRNWMQASAGPATVQPEPGQVYAAMLAVGDAAREPSASGPAGEFPLASGAGLIKLPASGRGWWGSVQVGSQKTQDVPFEVDEPGLKRLRLAIWWADPRPRNKTGSTPASHYDFDLELVAPNSEVRASSTGVNGVFERVELSLAGGVSGVWVARVHGGDVGAKARTVYVAIIAD